MSSIQLNDDDINRDIHILSLEVYKAMTRLVGDCHNGRSYRSGCCSWASTPGLARVAVGRVVASQRCNCVLTMLCVCHDRCVLHLRYGC